jgi:hypothetical protein
MPYEIVFVFLYFSSTAFECRMAVAIMSLPSGIDFSQYIPEYKESSTAVHFASEITNSRDELATKTMKMMHVDSNLNLEGMVSSTTSINAPQSGK